MNAPFARATSSTWDVVRGNWFIMEPADFSEPPLIVLDADTGKQYAFGRNKLGVKVHLQLYAPLCCGCDEPLPDNGACSNCEVLHADMPRRVM